MDQQSNIATKNTQAVLLQLVQQIKDPLEAIMQANTGVAEQLFGRPDQTATVTLENSKKIAALLEEILAQTQPEKSKEQPLFFSIYQDNPLIQKMCKGTVDEKTISKVDKKWLLEVEKVVFNETQLDQLSLFGLAFEVSVSERQLHRNIKKFLKLTPNKYVRILKLHKAKQLLEDYVYKTIAEVAYAAGFNDAHYFSKQFHLQYGQWPKELIPG